MAKGPTGFIADKHVRIEFAGALYGIVQSDPLDFHNRVFVILPDFDPDLKWGPCRWQSRDDTNRPQRGDEALVVFDNRRDPWLIAWWPFIN